MTDTTQARLAAHQSDGNGGCVICRQWVRDAEDDETYVIEAWPCPTVRLAERKALISGRFAASIGVGTVTMKTSHPRRSSSVVVNFRRFAAAWRFTPLKAGACKVEYTMEYEFSSSVVAAILEPVFKRIADGIMEAFTRRAR